MKNRGLYHQPDGSESRPDADSFSEHLSDNQVVEGEAIQRARDLFSSGQFEAFGAFMAELQDDGWSNTRVYAVVSQATRGRIPCAKPN